MTKNDFGLAVDRSVGGWIDGSNRLRFAQVGSSVNENTKQAPRHRSVSCLVQKFIISIAAAGVIGKSCQDRPCQVSSEEEWRQRRCVNGNSLAGENLVDRQSVYHLVTITGVHSNQRII